MYENFHKLKLQSSNQHNKNSDENTTTIHGESIVFNFGALNLIGKYNFIIYQYNYYVLCLFYTTYFTKFCCMYHGA